MRLRHMLSALFATALILGTAAAAGIAFDDATFDPYDLDEGYVDIALEDDVLTFTFGGLEGSVPGTMAGASLPLDADFDAFRLRRADSLALYGGLPVELTPTSMRVELDGDSVAIRDAILARLHGLGLTTTECFGAGPICSYDVTDGESQWLLSITPGGTYTTVHLQANR